MTRERPVAEQVRDDQGRLLAEADRPARVPGRRHAHGEEVAELQGAGGGQRRREPRRQLVRLGHVGQRCACDARSGAQRREQIFERVEAPGIGDRDGELGRPRDGSDDPASDRLQRVVDLLDGGRRVDAHGDLTTGHADPVRRDLGLRVLVTEAGVAVLHRSDRGRARSAGDHAGAVPDDDGARAGISRAVRRDDLERVRSVDERDAAAESLAGERRGLAVAEDMRYAGPAIAGTPSHGGERLVEPGVGARRVDRELGRRRVGGGRRRLCRRGGRGRRGRRLPGHRRHGLVQAPGPGPLQRLQLLALLLDERAALLSRAMRAEERAAPRGHLALEGAQPLGLRLAGLDLRRDRIDRHDGDGHLAARGQHEQQADRDGERQSHEAMLFRCVGSAQASRGLRRHRREHRERCGGDKVHGSTSLRFERSEAAGLWAP